MSLIFSWFDPLPVEPKDPELLTLLEIVEREIKKTLKLMVEGREAGSANAKVRFNPDLDWLRA
jgi:hypothetical protein